MRAILEHLGAKRLWAVTVLAATTQSPTVTYATRTQRSIRSTFGAADYPALVAADLPAEGQFLTSN
jgi:hypothetical protein